MVNAPEIGAALPAFELPAVSATSAAAVVLTPGRFAGRPWVLFFYPRDATPGCTIEVCGFRDLFRQFQELGADIVGVSRDTLRSHRRFIDNQQLPYTLASDAEGKLMQSWSLIIDAKMYGKPVTKVARTTLVMDGAGTVRHRFDRVTPLGHAQQVLECVRGLAGG